MTKHKSYYIPLWHRRKGNYVAQIDSYGNKSKLHIDIIKGASKFLPGPSLKIPGAMATYKKFECPKCLNIHRFPKQHGARLRCDCGAHWSFWGAGLINPEGCTYDEVLAIIKRWRPDILAGGEKRNHQAKTSKNPGPGAIVFLVFIGIMGIRILVSFLVG